MSKVIESIERAQVREDIPQFKAGDTVRVHFKVIEGQRARIQVIEGIVLKRQGAGARETFTVRKQSFGVGVERTFPLHSPKIEKIEVAAIGDVNRAKLYYLRGRVGKKARVRERRYGAGSELPESVRAGLAAAENELTAIELDDVDVPDDVDEPVAAEEGEVAEEAPAEAEPADEEPAAEEVPAEPAEDAAADGSSEPEAAAAEPEPAPAE